MPYNIKLLGPIFGTLTFFVTWQLFELPTQALIPGFIFGFIVGYQVAIIKKEHNALNDLTVDAASFIYKDRNGKEHRLVRQAPDSFGGWTPVEKAKWLNRAENDLRAQAVAHLEREEKENSE